MPAKKRILPQIIYVSRIEAADPDCDDFEAQTDIVRFQDGDTIGVYELKEIKKMSVSHSLK